MKGKNFMGKLTKEQIQKINNQCQNNWELDMQYYFFHNEKQLITKIELDQENYLQFQLSYNYNNEITLHIAKYHHKVGESFAVSEGLGKRKVLSIPQTRKSMNTLIEYTKELTTEELQTINANTPVDKNCMFVESEDF